MEDVRSLQRSGEGESTATTTTGAACSGMPAERGLPGSGECEPGLIVTPFSGAAFAFFSPAGFLIAFRCAPKEKGRKIRNTISLISGTFFLSFFPQWYKRYKHCERLRIGFAALGRNSLRSLRYLFFSLASLAFLVSLPAGVPQRPSFRRGARVRCGVLRSGDTLLFEPGIPFSGAFLETIPSPATLPREEERTAAPE